MSDDVKVPPFKTFPENDDWRAFLFNQETMLEQQNTLIEIQRRLADAMEKVASPERTRKVEEGQTTMVAAINLLSEKMEFANEQLGLAVAKLASAFWGLMKVPVAVIVIGVASWAFLYEHKISENTWLIMLGVSVFPWLGDSISGIAKLIGIRRNGNGENK